MLIGDLSEIGFGVFRDLRDALILFDPDTLEILGANPAATRLTGFNLRALRAKNVRELLRVELGEEPSPRLLSPPDECSRTLDGHFWLAAKYGRALPVRITVGRIRTSTGSVGLLTAWEISDPRDARETAERFFEASADLFCVVDRRGAFLRLNPVWEETIGVPVADLHGTKFFDRIHPDDLLGVRKACRVLKRFGSVRRAECRYRRGDGRWLWLSWSAVAADGLHHVVARDVSRDKERENLLRLAKEEAEAANRNRTHFFAKVGHEIRTPLTAILALGDLLSGEERVREDESVFGKVSTIQSNGRHLMQILDDLLDLSQLEKGILRIKVEPCRPFDIVEETVALLKIGADLKELSLVVDRHRGCPDVIRTDPIRLRQVLMNLVGNAIKYTARGEIRVELRPLAPIRPGGRPRLCFEVADTGPGIPAEEISRLFEAFERGSQVSAKVKGAGLGLPICRRLMNLLGGSIEVSSTPGLGSRFSVLLEFEPAAESAIAENEPGTTDDESAASIVSSSLPVGVLDVRVLLVEDTRANQTAIAMCLQVAGADVTVASDGAAAIELALAAEADGKPFEVVLMDMQMPVLDGYESTRQLRQRGYSRPIVALSAYGPCETEEEWARIGCDGFVGKPIDWRRLVALIRELTEPRPRFAAATG